MPEVVPGEPDGALAVPALTADLDGQVHVEAGRAVARDGRAAAVRLQARERRDLANIWSKSGDVLMPKTT